jgi:hypothetical protein
MAPDAAPLLHVASAGDAEGSTVSSSWLASVWSWIAGHSLLVVVMVSLGVMGVLSSDGKLVDASLNSLSKPVIIRPLQHLPVDPFNSSAPDSGPFGLPSLHALLDMSARNITRLPASMRPFKLESYETHVERQFFQGYDPCVRARARVCVCVCVCVCV